MAQKRFTADEAERIAEAAAHHAFKDRIVAAIGRRDRIAVEIIEREIARQWSKEHVVMYRGMPEGWLDLWRRGSIRVAGQWMEFPPLPVPDALRIEPLERGDKLADRYEAATDAIKALRDERSQRRSETKATVLAIGTLKKLREQWPEIVPLVPRPIIDRHDAPAKVGLPVNLSDLNRALDLPPGDGDHATTDTDTAAA